MKWLGTPYHNCADIIGVGVDCAMLPVRVYQALGHVKPDFDPRPYSPTWFLHQDADLYLQAIGLHAHRVERPDIGDLLMFRFGRTASHSAIVVSDDMMIHAYRQSGRVELCEIRALQDRLHSYWSVFP